jgi:hypothetical protein
MDAPSYDELTAELKDVEETLARLRREGGAPSSQEPGDQGDDAVDLTNYEEEQALIEHLESRRERLTAQLREAGPTD